jgi:hypothetical protein
MGEAPHEQHRQPHPPANRVTALLRSRGGRLAAIPILVAVGALTINYAVQAASDTSPVRIEASSEQPQNKQEEKTVTDEQAKKSPETRESVTGDGSGATTNVTVNGETITVPENGSYRKTTDDGTTRTDVKVDSRNQSSTSGDGASNSSSSKIQVNVQSNSSSESVSN